MWSWLRNLVGTPSVRDPSYTELLLEFAQIQAEWQAFLEQQARVSKRAAKRVRDDQVAAQGAQELEMPVAPGDKAMIRQRAIARGLFRTNQG